MQAIYIYSLSVYFRMVHEKFDVVVVEQKCLQTS